MNNTAATMQQAGIFNRFGYIVTFLLLSLLGCDGFNEPVRQPKPTYIISSEGKGVQSTTAGNLMATAIRDVHNLDVVLYPVDFLQDDKAVLFKPDMTAEEKQDVLDYYPDEFFDTFMIGTMTGEDLAAFVRERAAYKYQMDLEVAGLVYAVGFVSGVETSGDAAFSFDWNAPLEEDKLYRVAISEMLYFNGVCFPCYLFGDNMNFRFNLTGTEVSAKDSLNQFMNGSYAWPWLNQIRGRVFHGKHANKTPKVLEPYQIQGESHMSPYWNHKVTTKGVVTAVAINQWYPGGVDMYVQSVAGDGNPATSDAVHVYLQEESNGIRIGDFIEVTGVVYEQMSESTEMGRTSIREVSDIKVLLRGVALPAPVVLGKQGRPIPRGRLSTFRGNINEKSYLTLTDGLDFWESLEGMRVAVNDIRVVGFRGGNEDHESSTVNTRGFLNIYFVPDGLHGNYGQETTGGKGIYADISRFDWNPEIMQVATNHLTAAIDKGYIFNVGDEIPGRIEGVLGYERNIFGDGEYSLVLPQESSFDAVYGFLSQKCESIQDQMEENGFLECLSDRDKSSIKKNQCTVKNIKSQESRYLGNKNWPEYHEMRVKLESSDGCDHYQALMSFGSRDWKALPYFAQLKETELLRRRQPEDMNLLSSDDHLTVASFNVENLAGNEPRRIEVLANSIVSNLKCPDIVSLVEIQDDNGSDFSGSSGADGTLNQLVASIENVKAKLNQKLFKRLDERSMSVGELYSDHRRLSVSSEALALIENSKVPEKHSAMRVAADAYVSCDAEYGFANIDPLENAEGGKPGGNIRVAFLYKKEKVTFAPRPIPSPRAETIIGSNGSIIHNPGRVVPNSKAFAGSRRSIVAEFGYKGEKIFFIGNHFNSKLGDVPAWSAEQPPVFKSERKRIPMAEAIRVYVQRLLQAAPRANVIVVGDFNAFMEEASMKVLKGNVMVSLTEELLPMASRYTTNHNGNSQSLDYIFVNKAMMAKSPEVRVLHINSDFMGRISDHDPVVARFRF